MIGFIEFLVVVLVTLYIFQIVALTAMLAFGSEWSLKQTFESKKEALIWYLPIYPYIYTINKRLNNLK